MDGETERIGNGGARARVPPGGRRHSSGRVLRALPPARSPGVQARLAEASGGPRVGFVPPRGAGTTASRGLQRGTLPG